MHAEDGLSTSWTARRHDGHHCATDTVPEKAKQQLQFPFLSSKLRAAMCQSASAAPEGKRALSLLCLSSSTPVSSPY